MGFYCLLVSYRNLFALLFCLLVLYTRIPLETYVQVLSLFYVSASLRTVTMYLLCRPLLLQRYFLHRFALLESDHLIPAIALILLGFLTLILLLGRNHYLLK